MPLQSADTNPTHNPYSIASAVQVAFGLSGNHPGFLAEFEVALKSVLINAPLERKMSIHILADKEAFVSLNEIFNRTELPTWRTRNPIEIHAYNVSSDQPQMEREIIDVHNPAFPSYSIDLKHTIGAFYRLFVDRYVSTRGKYILYMDTDVVIMSNLEALWRLVERQQMNVLFHWGKTMCSGFVVMNLPRVKEILALAKRSKFMKNETDGSKLDLNSDQTIYQAVNISYPNEVNVLPPGWDMTVTEIWQSNNHPYDKKFPNVGMLHFNGGGSTKYAYFDGENGTEHNFITTFKDTWGNGKFYATLPWEWARYQAKSLILSNSIGHPIEFFWDEKSTFSGGEDTQID